MSILEKNINIICIKDIKFSDNLKGKNWFILTKSETKLNKNNEYRG